MSELIEYVELRFVDVLGRLKAMTVPCKPAKDLEELANDPILEEGTSLDGSSVPGLADVEHSDLRLEPDPSTLVELPFRSQRVAAAMCFIGKATSSMITVVPTRRTAPTDGNNPLRMFQSWV